MKILLLGGTGAMGSHLVNLLLNEGKKVVVTSRKQNILKELVEYRIGNAKNLDFLTEVLKEKWDVIVDFMVYSDEEFNERINLLLDSAYHYIFLSSSRVYNESKDAVTEEFERLLDSSLDYDFLATNEYSLSKARQEDMLRLSNRENWTIVRPYITYSEKRLQLGNLEKQDWLYRALKGRCIVFSKDINYHLTSLTYGLDVASGIYSLIINSRAKGETYHITNENAIRWCDILEIYLNMLEKKFGNRPKVIYQELSDYLVWNPGKYQIIYDRLFDRKFDNNKINQFVNTEKFINVNEGLEKCLNTFLSNPEFDNINWKSEALKDKFTGEKTPLKEISGFKQKLKYVIFRYL